MCFEQIVAAVEKGRKKGLISRFGENRKKTVFTELQEVTLKIF